MQNFPRVVFKENFLSFQEKREKKLQKREFSYTFFSVIKL